MSYKIILKQNGYFSHIGSDPVENAIEQSEKWNVSNQPTAFHYWDSAAQDFILDEDLYKQDLKSKLLTTIFELLDLSKLKSIDNFSYSYDEESYTATKSNLLLDIETNRALISTLDNLTIDAIKALQLTKNSELAALEESLKDNIFYKQYRTNRVI